MIAALFGRGVAAFEVGDQRSQVGRLIGGDGGHLLLQFVQAFADVGEHLVDAILELQVRQGFGDLVLDALCLATQFGVTVWGVRDSDSWLRRADWHRPPEPDNPLLFDDSGRPKASAQAFADALG